MSNKKRNSTFQQKLTYDKLEFPDLSSDNIAVLANENEIEILCNFKKILSEKNNEEQEIIKLRKGWVYLYKDSLMKKNNSFFQRDEDEDIVTNNISLSLEMKRAIQLMNKNWEKNKEYDMEMMPYEQYLRIYRRLEYLYEMDPDQEEDEENNESYCDYDDYYE